MKICAWCIQWFSIYHMYSAWISGVGTCGRWVIEQLCVGILGIVKWWFAFLSLDAGEKLVVWDGGIGFPGNVPKIPVLFHCKLCWVGLHEVVQWLVVSHLNVLWCDVHYLDWYALCCHEYFFCQVIVIGYGVIWVGYLLILEIQNLLDYS